MSRLMISQHRSVEQKVLAELGKQRLLASASNPEPRAMTHDDLALLPYTANAIKAWACSRHCSHLSRLLWLLATKTKLCMHDTYHGPVLSSDLLTHAQDDRARNSAAL